MGPLVALRLGYFMVILDATIVTVALPPMGADLTTGGGLAGAQWVADGYTVVFAGLLLSAGSIGDRLGRAHVAGADPRLLRPQGGPGSGHRPLGSHRRHRRRVGPRAGRPARRRVRLALGVLRESALRPCWAWC
jgi:hypothetical protein